MFPGIGTRRLFSAGSSRSSLTRHGASTEKFTHPLCDEVTGIFKGEMTRVDQVQLRFREIPSVCLGSLHGEERIVLPPENQHSRLSFAEVLMPTVIERDIRLIVVKKIKLDCVIARTIEEELVHRIGIRADSVGVFNPMRVLEEGHFFCQEITHGFLRFGSAIGPERLHRVKRAANTLRVCVTVLNDNALNSRWMF